ncbi:MAG: hypothetical protein HY744_31420 [Deltaproteobacteria bacterium]|nr:hypothetical protein [Deltaproteobacteria bacterium]
MRWPKWRWHGCNIVLAGSFFGKLNFGGAALQAGPSLLNVFLAKLDSKGAHLHSAQFGDAGAHQYASEIAVDAQNNIVLGGYFSGKIGFGGGERSSKGGLDAYVATFDASGKYLWDRAFGDAADQWTWAVAVDAAKNVVVAGDFRGQASFGGATHVALGRDVFLAKYAPDGSYLWSSRHGDGAGQFVQTLATNSGRQIIVAGWFDGKIGFGGAELSSDGADIFLAILKP